MHLGKTPNIRLTPPKIKIHRKETTSKHTTSLTMSFLLSVRTKRDGPKYDAPYKVNQFNQQFSFISNYILHNSVSTHIPVEIYGSNKKE